MIRYFLFYMLLFSFCRADIFVVDVSTGNDANTYSQCENDTANYKWATLGRAMWGSTTRSSPNSGEAVTAGDTVIVYPGSYKATTGTDDRNEPIYRCINDGASGNPIVFLCQYPATDSTTTAAQYSQVKSETSGGGEGVIGLSGNSYVVLDGFYILEDSVDTRNDDSPVQYKGSDNCTIKRFLIDCVDAEEEWGWSYSTNHSGIRVENATGGYIEDCKIFGMGGSHHNVSGILFYDSHSITIRHNEIYDGNTLIHLKGDQTAPSNQGNFTIYLNYLHDGTRGIEVATVYAVQGNTAIYQNLIKNCTLAGIGSRSYDSTSPRDIDVINNVIVDCGGSTYGAFYLKSGAGHDDWVFRNNIIYSSYRGCDATERTDLNPFNFDYNCFNSNNYQARLNYTNRDWSYWTTTLGFGSNSLTSDPQFTDAVSNDYTLQATSPCTTGVDILDLDGDSATDDTIDMGIYVLGTEIVGIQGGETVINEDAPAASQKKVDVVNVEEN